jgi:hypothetical protein
MLHCKACSKESGPKLVVRDRQAVRLCTTDDQVADILIIHPSIPKASNLSPSGRHEVRIFATYIRGWPPCVLRQYINMMHEILNLSVARRN